MESPHIVRKTTDPVSAPPETGIHWINTSTGDEFFSVGTSVVGDWSLRNSGGGGGAVDSVNGYTGVVVLAKSDIGLGSVVNSDTTTTANITDSSNKRFVTDAQLAVIGNTSGTNTGDQTSVTGNAGTVSVVDAGGDTTTFPLLGTSATGNLSPSTDSGLTYNATTKELATTTFSGALSGNASSASSVALAGITGLGVDVSTFLATPTSANLAIAITDETGSGALVFGTSPTFTTSITTPLVIGGSSVSSGITYKTTTGAGSTGAHIFQTGNNGATEAMRILNNGNIGVGVNNTSSRFHILKNSGDQLRVGYDVANYYTTTVSSSGGVTFDAIGSGAGFTFSDPVTSATLIGGTAAGSTLTYKSTTGVGTTSAHIFQVGNNGATEAMRITNDGLIQVGSVTAVEKISVSGNVGGLGNVAASFYNANASGFANNLFTNNLGHTMYVGVGGSTTTYDAYIRRGFLDPVGLNGLSLIASDVGTDIRFYNGGYTSADESVRIDADGNMGIGITTPLFKIDVNGESAARFDNGDGGTLTIDQTEIAIYSASVPVSITTEGSAVTVDAGGGSVTINPTSGSVGIGTASPSASAILDLTSTTTAFLPPRMTTTQKNAISASSGMVVYDTTLGKLCVRGASAWETITSV
jgi:hypothetical protein